MLDRTEPVEMARERLVEFLKSRLSTKYVISGEVEDTPINFHDFAGIFPSISGRYNFGAWGEHTSIDHLRALVDLELTDRLVRIPKNEDIYEASRFLNGVRGYPEVAVAWGRRIKDGQEAILLCVLQGASPQEEFAKFKDRLRLALNRHS